MARLLLLLVCAGCGGLFGDNGDGGTTGGTTGAAGFGMPTLEVTVNGVHSGPAAPDGNSFVDLVNQYDTTGSLSRSSLQIVGSSSAANASCSLAADRYGDFVSSFGVGQYQLSGSGLNGTPDGTATPVGAPAAATSQGVFSCTGSACNGVGLSLTWIDANHAEGFFSGNLSGASVICSFYLPTRTFRP
jgi:hypothetical protein